MKPNDTISVVKSGPAAFETVHLKPVRVTDDPGLAVHPCTPEGYYTALRPLTGAAKYACGALSDLIRAFETVLFPSPPYHTQPHTVRR